MSKRRSKAIDYVALIRASGLSIHDDLPRKPKLFIPAAVLESLISEALIGMELKYPLRTRSKKVKQEVCRALGYPVPTSFKKVQPRFLGQNFDTYVQKSDNLQIWNEEVSPSRRYVLIRLDSADVVTSVRVVSGEVLADFDTTGTLTRKYQAAARSSVERSMLDASRDTQNLCGQLEELGILPIAQLFERLNVLVGQSFQDPGLDQERNRGAILHELAQLALNYEAYSNSGRFPDVQSQLLELKLQTSPTIDLGLISPDSTETLETQPSVRHCDVRYGVFYGDIKSGIVQINAVVVTTGERFFEFFKKFGGLKMNRKLQLRLPSDFFG